MEEKRKTVGELSRDLLLKEDKATHTVDEQANANLSEYERNIEQCIAENKSKYLGDFYVVVLVKKERLMQNVMRNYFFARTSCPTPNYDQIVYKYHRKEDRIEFIWTIPDRTICNHMIQFKHLTPSSHLQLLSYVIDFSDGTLFKRSKELNGEKELTSELKDT